MNTRRYHPRSEQASALLLVLWALLLLSVAVITWARQIQDGIILHGENNRGLEARAIAHSAVTFALHPLTTLETTPPPLPDGQSFRWQMVGEGARLNINWLLRGEDPRKMEILKKWLESRGLDLQQREVFLDSLLDYLDADNVTRLNGFEGDDTLHPANRELRSISEIAAVNGSAPLVASPGWADDLTVLSQGPIDFSSASAEILSLLPGMSESRLQQFVEYRRGPDGLDGTVDDVPLKSLADIQEILGFSKSQFEQLGGLVTNKDSTQRIIAVGTSGHVSYQVEVVARRNGAKSQILLWKE